MDTSGNLISLSDSGIGAPSSSSPAPSSSSNRSVDGSTNNNGEGDFFVGGTKLSGVAPPTPSSAAAEHVCNGSGVLIDWDDEILVPMPQAILNQAECDDTFGVFSRAREQEQQQTEKKVLSKLRDEEDAAVKLVRSFTSGRKSEPPRVDTRAKKSDGSAGELTDELEKEEGDNKGKRKSHNDSIGSCTSDQPTIVDPEEELGDFPDFPEEENGISDVKMDSNVGRNISTGSDSEIMDINNLSSFSIPDGDMEEILEDIKREDMASSTVTNAIVNQIKLEMLLDKDEADSVSIPQVVFKKREMAPFPDAAKIMGERLADISCPTLNSTTASRFGRLSVSSSVGGGRPRLSSCSSIGNDDAQFMPTVSECMDKTVPRRGRISNMSSIVGSPIRASYPMSQYMPTPKSFTPLRSNTPRGRDRLSESLCSPTRTRVFLQTGGANLSPSRVPVRKSISAETLHFHQSPVRTGIYGHQQVTFSTPKPSRNRYSFHVVEEGQGNLNQNVAEPRDSTFVRPNNGAGEANKMTEAEMWKNPRLDRLSYSSTSSYASSAVPSPTSTFIKREREISLLSKQVVQLNIKEAAVGKVGRGDGLTSVGIQPLRATAVVPPTTLDRVADSSNGKANPFRTKAKTPPTATTASGQRKFIPPIAASSPKLGPSPARPAATKTTPSRSRFSVNARSSGYGQQNLSATFAKSPLTSPNKVTTDTEPTVPKATVKPAAIPKSLKGGLVTLGSKFKPTGLPAPKAATQTGLRRPATVGASAAVNKENNNGRPGTRIGLPSRPRQ